MNGDARNSSLLFFLQRFLLSLSFLLFFPFPFLYSSPSFLWPFQRFSLWSFSASLLEASFSDVFFFDGSLFKASISDVSFSEASFSICLIFSDHFTSAGRGASAVSVRGTAGVPIHGSWPRGRTAGCREPSSPCSQQGAYRRAVSVNYLETNRTRPTVRRR